MHAQRSVPTGTHTTKKQKTLAYPKTFWLGLLRRYSLWNYKTFHAQGWQRLTNTQNLQKLFFQLCWLFIFSCYCDITSDNWAFARKLFPLHVVFSVFRALRKGRDIDCMTLAGSCNTMRHLAAARWNWVRIFLKGQKNRGCFKNVWKGTHSTARYPFRNASHLRSSLASCRYNLRPPVSVLWLLQAICPSALIPDFGLMSLKFRVRPCGLQVFLEIFVWMNKKIQ